MSEEQRIPPEEAVAKQEAGTAAQTPPEEIADVAAASAELTAAAVRPVTFGPLEPETDASGDARNLDLLLDVEIPVSVQVGQARLSLEEILQLVPGRIVTLDKKAEEAVELRVNGKLVALGEVVLVDDSYGLRVTQIIDQAGRIESLR